RNWQDGIRTCGADGETRPAASEPPPSASEMLGVVMLESVHPGSSTPSPEARRSAPPRRRLVILAPPEGMADCILFALQREFAWVSITHCAEPEEAAYALDEPASLVLVDRSFLPAFDLRAPRRHHPAARFVVMLDDHSEADELVHMLFQAGAIRGVLPMNLKLDVWLSAVGLLLRGGEYLPASVVRSWAGAHSAQHQAAAPAVGEGDGGNERAVCERLAELTERERQVLEKV